MTGAALSEEKTREYYLCSKFIRDILISEFSEFGFLSFIVELLCKDNPASLDLEMGKARGFGLCITSGYHQDSSIPPSL